MQTPAISRDLHRPEKQAYTQTRTLRRKEHASDTENKPALSQLQMYKIQKKIKLEKQWCHVENLIEKPHA